MQTINHSDLNDYQLNEIENKANDTLPQGQSFFLEIETGEIVAVENNLRSLYEAQNSAAIAAELIFLIVFD